MSGTDPNGKWFGKKGDPTSPFQPAGSGPEPTLPHDLPKIPGITLHYELARGGMGVVYSGRQDFLDRRVAVKFLSVDLGGASFAQRFQREAKILAGISHPNIIACHMADTTANGQSYLVMEFCDGPSLKAWVADNGPVAPLAALRLIRACAQALAHAHQSEIIHRDIKPENILLETVTSTSLDIRFPFVPKICDLGLARMTHEQVGAGLTSPGSVMGTPSTMSPEQFDDPDSVDFRSDIYGLGCCLYEMLVGHPAFRGGKLTDIVVRKRDPKAPNPCDENPQVPAAVGAFTQRLLACAREDRPGSYKQLDLEANELMTALLSQRSRTDTRVDGGGMDQTIPSAPGNFGGTRSMGTQPARTQPASTQPFQEAQPKAASGGMLNTGEFEFLAAGGVVGGEPGAASGFRDVTVAGPTSGTTAGTAPTGLAAASPAANSKKGLFIGLGAVVLIGGAVAVVLSNGGKDAATGTTSGNASGGNSAPTIASIKLLVAGKETADPIVDLGATFELVVDAKDKDGDPIDYKWVWPSRAMNLVSPPDAANIRFRMDDGLPGVEHVVQLEVRDASSIASTKREFRVVVGKCREEMPLIGFDATGMWEKLSGIWRDTLDPANPANRGAVGRVADDQNAVLSAAVGSDAYWEWSGSLEPSEMGEGEASAMVALQYGPSGYAIQCARVKDETEWSVEVLEQVPGDTAWRPLSPPVAARWVQPQKADGTTRGWFSLRRLNDQLQIEIGEFAQPAPEPGQPLVAPTIQRQKPVTVELTESDRNSMESAGKLQLIVTKARCVFRATRR